jgi:hypothetical protein
MTELEIRNNKVLEEISSHDATASSDIEERISIDSMKDFEYSCIYFIASV